MDQDTTIVFFSIGNPGSINRHSTGHYVLKKLLDYYNAKQLVKVTGKKYSKSTLNNVVFAKSNTYMNDSQVSFKQLIDTERIRFSLARIFIIYDDYHLNLPGVKILPMKKSCSHNGIKSIQKSLMALNYENIYQLGVAIGPKPSNSSKEVIANWVLSDFKPDEKKELDDKSIPLLIDIVNYIIEQGDNVNDYGMLNKKIPFSI